MGVVATVLVRDDGEALCVLVRTTLEPERMEAIEAVDAAEALEAIRRCRPDLVIVDMATPRRPAADVLGGLRDDATLAHVPVLVLKAQATTWHGAGGCKFRAGNESYEPRGLFAVVAATRVLVCDNEEALRVLVRATLEPDGIEVIEAIDGDQALEVIRRSRPDLIVLDMMMPGRSGIEVLRELRGDPALEHIPVLVLTARAQATDREAALVAGADRFLTKPFSPRELSSMVAGLLDSASSAAAHFTASWATSSAGASGWPTRSHGGRAQRRLSL